MMHAHTPEEGRIDTEHTQDMSGRSNGEADDLRQNDNPENDQETAEALVPTESDPLVEEHRQASRKESLWGRLRKHRESFAYHWRSIDEPVEDAEVRRSRLLDLFTKRIRGSLDFSLTQCLLAIILYLVIAVLAYSFVFQKWPIIDSLYFACVTFTTIGFGDIVPTSNKSKLFTAFFALSGVACLGIALGVLGSNLIDTQVQAIERAREVSRYQVTSLFHSSSRNLSAVDDEHKETKKESRSALPWYRSSLVIHSLPLFTILLFCCWLMGHDEKWDVISTFYFCIITACTIGYGDLSPQTQGARLGAVIFIPVAVGAMGRWLSLVANAIIERRLKKFKKNLETHELTVEDLEVMDDNGDGCVTRVEFLEFMLVAMNKVDQALINDLTAQFNRLDVAGNGKLDREDLLVLAKRKLKSPKRKLELAEYKKKLLSKGKKKEEFNVPFGFMGSIYRRGSAAAVETETL